MYNDDENKQLSFSMIMNFITFIIISIILVIFPEYKKISSILEAILHLNITCILLMICGFFFLISGLILLYIGTQTIHVEIAKFKAKFFGARYENQTEPFQLTHTSKFVLFGYIVFIIIVIAIVWKSLLALGIVLWFLFQLFI